MTNSSGGVRLDAYRPTDFLTEDMAFSFALGKDQTRVTCRQRLRRRVTHCRDGWLELHGRDFDLIEFRMNGALVDVGALERDGDTIRLRPDTDEVVIETMSSVSPSANSASIGLFMDGEAILSHMESDGMRRLTFCQDRPDVLARYVVRLEGDRELYPVLLSNGECIETGECGAGRHFAVWRDDMPKPSYIFAIAAGAWARNGATFVTRSGKAVAVSVYAPAARIGATDFLLGALQRAMRWDEESYGRECDLSTFNVVVPDRHAISQENKGLMLLEAAFAFADPQLTTDDDFDLVERIAAHEYFHNWTGNRVTIRDWFQLSVKEGLTRFRDQQFSADMSAPDVKRINTVRALRTNQIPEDTGPAAHPVQPKSYAAVSNLYTATVYDKGAEIIRMAHALVGGDGFRKGMDLYFERHDGQAVTIADLMAALSEGSGRDLSQFSNWYHVAGQPVVSMSVEERPAAREICVRFVQENSSGTPLHIPLRLGVVTPDGHEKALSSPHVRSDGVYELVDREQALVLEDVEPASVVSVNRGYTAPVRLVAQRTDPELIRLFRHDADGYSRWDSGQELMGRAVRRLASRKYDESDPAAIEPLLEALARVLRDDGANPSLKAELLTFPHLGLIADSLPEIDVDGLAAASLRLRRSFAQRCAGDLHELFERNRDEENFSFDPSAKGRRRLRAVCLDYLLETDDAMIRGVARDEAIAAPTMTARSAALYSLCNFDCEERDAALEALASRWGGVDALMKVWYRAQALSRCAGTAERVRSLAADGVFSIRNVPMAMALFGGFFRQNRVAFHESSGAGYRLLADTVLSLDRIRPQGVRWLMPQIVNWRRFDAHRRALMEAELRRIASTSGISPALEETVRNALRDPSADAGG